MSTHYKNECEHGMIMGQCRCPSPNKVVHIVECPSTAEHDDLVQSLQVPQDGPEGDSEPVDSIATQKNLISRLKALRDDVRAIEYQIQNVIADMEDS